MPTPKGKKSQHYQSLKKETKEKAAAKQDEWFHLTVRFFPVCYWGAKLSYWNLVIKKFHECLIKQIWLFWFAICRRTLLIVFRTRDKLKKSFLFQISYEFNFSWHREIKVRKPRLAVENILHFYILSSGQNEKKIVVLQAKGKNPLLTVDLIVWLLWLLCIFCFFKSDLCLGVMFNMLISQAIDVIVASLICSWKSKANQITVSVK